MALASSATMRAVGRLQSKGVISNTRIAPAYPAPWTMSSVPYVPPDTMKNVAITSGRNVSLAGMWRQRAEGESRGDPGELTKDNERCLAWGSQANTNRKGLRVRPEAGFRLKKKNEAQGLVAVSASFSSEQ